MKGIDGSEAILTLHNVASSEINFVTFGAFINLARTDRLLRVENCDEGPECYVLIQEAEEKNHPMVDVVVHPEDDDPELRGLMPHCKYVLYIVRDSYTASNTYQPFSCPKSRSTIRGHSTLGQLLLHPSIRMVHGRPRGIYLLIGEQCQCWLCKQSSPP